MRYPFQLHILVIAFLSCALHVSSAVRVSEFLLTAAVSCPDTWHYTFPSRSMRRATLFSTHTERITSLEAQPSQPLRKAEQVRAPVLCLCTTYSPPYVPSLYPFDPRTGAFSLSPCKLRPRPTSTFCCCPALSSTSAKGYAPQQYPPWLLLSAGSLPMCLHESGRTRKERRELKGAICMHRTSDSGPTCARNHVCPAPASRAARGMRRMRTSLPLGPKRRTERCTKYPTHLGDFASVLHIGPGFRCPLLLNASSPLLGALLSTLDLHGQLLRIPRREDVMRRGQTQAPTMRVPFRVRMCTHRHHTRARISSASAWCA